MPGCLIVPNGALFFNTGTMCVVCTEHQFRITFASESRLQVAEIMQCVCVCMCVFVIYEYTELGHEAEATSTIKSVCI